MRSRVEGRGREFLGFAVLVLVVEAALEPLDVLGIGWVAWVGVLLVLLVEKGR